MPPRSLNPKAASSDGGKRQAAATAAAAAAGETPPTAPAEADSPLLSNSNSATPPPDSSAATGSGYSSASTSPVPTAQVNGQSILNRSGAAAAAATAGAPKLVALAFPTHFQPPSNGGAAAAGTGTLTNTASATALSPASAAAAVASGGGDAVRPRARRLPGSSAGSLAAPTSASITSAAAAVASLPTATTSPPARASVPAANSLAMPPATEIVASATGGLTLLAAANSGSGIFKRRNSGHSIPSVQPIIIERESGGEHESGSSGHSSGHSSGQSTEPNSGTQPTASTLRDSTKSGAKSGFHSIRRKRLPHASADQLTSTGFGSARGGGLSKPDSPDSAGTSFSHDTIMDSAPNSSTAASAAATTASATVHTSSTAAPAHSTLSPPAATISAITASPTTTIQAALTAYLDTGFGSSRGGGTEELIQSRGHHRRRPSGASTAGGDDATDELDEAGEALAHGDEDEEEDEDDDTPLAATSVAPRIHTGGGTTLAPVTAITPPNDPNRAYTPLTLDIERIRNGATSIRGGSASAGVNGEPVESGQTEPISGASTTLELTSSTVTTPLTRGGATTMNFTLPTSTAALTSHANGSQSHAANASGSATSGVTQSKPPLPRARSSPSHARDGSGSSGSSSGSGSGSTSESFTETNRSVTPTTDAAVQRVAASVTAAVTAARIREFQAQQQPTAVITPAVGAGHRNSQHRNSGLHPSQQQQHATSGEPARAAAAASAAGGAAGNPNAATAKRKMLKPSPHQSLRSISGSTATAGTTQSGGRITPTQQPQQPQPQQSRGYEPPNSAGASATGSGSGSGSGSGGGWDAPQMPVPPQSARLSPFNSPLHGPVLQRSVSAAAQPSAHYQSAQQRSRTASTINHSNQSDITPPSGTRNISSGSASGGSGPGSGTGSGSGNRLSPLTPPVSGPASYAATVMAGTLVLPSAATATHSSGGSSGNHPNSGGVRRRVSASAVPGSSHTTPDNTSPYVTYTAGGNVPMPISAASPAVPVGFLELNTSTPLLGPGAGLGIPLPSGPSSDLMDGDPHHHFAPSPLPTTTVTGSTAGGAQNASILTRRQIQHRHHRRTQSAALPDPTLNFHLNSLSALPVHESPADVGHSGPPAQGDDPADGLPPPHPHPASASIVQPNPVSPALGAVPAAVALAGLSVQINAPRVGGGYPSHRDNISNRVAYSMPTTPAHGVRTLGGGPRTSIGVGPGIPLTMVHGGGGGGTASGSGSGNRTPYHMSHPEWDGRMHRGSDDFSQSQPVVMAGVSGVRYVPSPIGHTPSRPHSPNRFAFSHGNGTENGMTPPGAGVPTLTLAADGTPVLSSPQNGYDISPAGVSMNGTRRPISGPTTPGSGARLVRSFSYSGSGTPISAHTIPVQIAGSSLHRLADFAYYHSYGRYEKFKDWLWDNVPTVPEPYRGWLKTFLTTVIISYIWLVIASSLRYGFDLSLEWMYGFMLLTIPFALLFEALKPPPVYYRLVHWMWFHSVRCLLWMSLSLVFLLVSLLDSPLMTEKQRTYVEHVTGSKLWIGLFVFEICLLIFALFDYVRFPKQMSPMPNVTKFFMCVSIVMVFGRVYLDDYAEHNCRLQLYHEYKSTANRDEVFRLQSLAETMLNSPTLAPGAGVFQAPKIHGCIKGRFEINRRIPSKRRVGIFATESASYPAWIRFNNFNRRAQDDSVPDMRGMSVKIIGVPGPKLSQNLSFVDAEYNTVDLLASSNELLPISAPSMYMKWLEAMASESLWPLIRLIFPSFNPFGWRFKFEGMRRRMYAEGASISNPLSSNYYSATPYRFKQEAVKFMFRACESNYLSLHRDRNFMNRSDYLRDNMRARLDPSSASSSVQHDDDGLDEVCFEFCVQRQRHACREPIEDPTIKWNGAWVPLATLWIPRQNFTTTEQAEFCHNLSFNVWQTLEVHKPLGGINEARAIMRRVSDVRLRKRDIKTYRHREPTGNETFETSASGKRMLPLPHIGAGDPYKYDYAPYPKPWNQLPRKIKAIRKDLQFGEHMERAFGNTLISAGMQTGPARALFDAFKTPDDYRLFVDGADSTEVLAGLPPTLDANNKTWAVWRYWKSDASFARGYIAGVHPTWIQVCTALPSIFHPTTEEHERIKAVADGASIDQLIQEKRLFIADYEILIDIDMSEGRIFYAPILLLFTKRLPNGKRQLMPLAIQLTRDRPPQPHNEIYTPPPDFDADPYSNDGLVWLFARMHVSSADGQIHQSITHLALTHLAMEPVLIGFYRQFSTDHPLMRIMAPHFRDTIAINHLGRETLLHPTRSDFERVMSAGLVGTLQLMQKAYHNWWSFKAYSFPEELRRRGFDPVPESAAESEDDILPGYVYRDYGFKMWRAIERYCASYVALNYRDDNAVLHDRQLHALIDELYDPQLGALPNERPELTSVPQLVDWLSTVMWTCTVGHSVMNFGQFDFYGFIPNRPLHLTKIMPAKKRQLTLSYVMSALPSAEYTEEIISLARTLTLRDGDGFLESHTKPDTDRVYMHSNLTSIHTEFVNDLKRIDREMADRNALNHWYYPYLRPSMIMPSIGI